MTERTIVVSKSQGRLRVFEGGRCVRVMACGSGRASGDKRAEGDAITPLGSYRLIHANRASRFFRSFGLSYPTPPHADAAEREGRLSADEARRIRTAHDTMAACRSLRDWQQNAAAMVATWYTPLGGEIMIHGEWDGHRGTAGCIAVRNADMAWLWDRCKLGDSVIIDE